MCEITLHVARIVHKEQLQIYIPYKHGFFRYIMVNILHKGDDNDDDDNNNNNNVLQV
jgi:hypothetical protein